MELINHNERSAASEAWAKAPAASVAAPSPSPSASPAAASVSECKEVSTPQKLWRSAKLCEAARGSHLKKLFEKRVNVPQERFTHESYSLSNKWKQKPKNYAQDHSKIEFWILKTSQNLSPNLLKSKNISKQSLKIVQKNERWFKMPLKVEKNV